MNNDVKHEIKIELAMQLFGEQRTIIRGYELVSDVDDFEDGAVMVRELVKGAVLDYAMEHARAVGRMRATVSQDGFEYQVEGKFNPKVGGLELEVAFRNKADFKKILVDIWNEEVGGTATFHRVRPGLDDNSTLH